MAHGDDDRLLRLPLITRSLASGGGSSARLLKRLTVHGGDSLASSFHGGELDEAIAS